MLFSTTLLVTRFHSSKLKALAMGKGKMLLGNSGVGYGLVGWFF